MTTIGAGRLDLFKDFLKIFEEQKFHLVFFTFLSLGRIRIQSELAKSWSWIRIISFLIRNPLTPTTVGIG